MFFLHPWGNGTLTSVTHCHLTSEWLSLILDFLILSVQCNWYTGSWESLLVMMISAYFSRPSPVLILLLLTSQNLVTFVICLRAHIYTSLAKLWTCGGSMVLFLFFFPAGIFFIFLKKYEIFQGTVFSCLPWLLGSSQAKWKPNFAYSKGWNSMYFRAYTFPHLTIPPSSCTDFFTFILFYGYIFLSICYRFFHLAWEMVIWVLSYFFVPLLEWSPKCMMSSLSESESRPKCTFGDPSHLLPPVYPLWDEARVSLFFCYFLF